MTDERQHLCRSFDGKPSSHAMTRPKKSHASAFRAACRIQAQTFSAIAGIAVLFQGAVVLSQETTNRVSVTRGPTVTVETTVTTKPSVRVARAALKIDGTNFAEIVKRDFRRDLPEYVGGTHETIFVGGKALVHTDKVGHRTVRTYMLGKLGKEGAITEVDEDGDGVFETVLFSDIGGVDLQGLKRLTNGDPAPLDAVTIGNYRREIASASGLPPTPESDPNGKETCTWNLRQIDGAKQMWALENRKIGAEIPKPTDLDPYLGTNGFASLKCPKGGVYSINPVIQPPSCSVHGQLP
jgi:hypothetical protein